MIGLSEYFRDGADARPRAILALIQEYCWTNDWLVTRWSNGSEQGYTIYRKALGDPEACQTNITFFEEGDSFLVKVWDFSSPHGRPPAPDVFDKYIQTGGKAHYKAFEPFDIEGAFNFVSSLL